jgi:hypothetical protein
MHDIDSTQGEDRTKWSRSAEPESFEYNFEQEQEMDFETGSPFDEIEETELAEGLLAVQS